MEDPEVAAITAISKAFASLSDQQCRNVLLYINARYGAPHTSTAPIEAKPLAGDKPSEDFGSIGDFFDAVNPQTESERVLAVSYWMHVHEGAEDAEAYPMNKHLKNLGHSVSNITRAMDSLMEQTPRLILQTSKTGSSKQARKKYKITREGMKRIKAMLAQNGGGIDGN